jgi:hypothetical protein
MKSTSQECGFQQLSRANRNPQRNSNLRGADPKILNQINVAATGTFCTENKPRPYRPELNRLLDQFRKGDVQVVWKLNRLSRSLRDVS